MNNAKWLSREQGQRTGVAGREGKLFKKKKRLEVNIPTNINHSQLWVVDWHYYVVFSTSLNF